MQKAIEALERRIASAKQNVDHARDSVERYKEMLKYEQEQVELWQAMATDCQRAIDVLKDQKEKDKEQ